MPPKTRGEAKAGGTSENPPNADPVTLPQEYVDRLLSANDALTKAVQALTRDRMREPSVTASSMSAALSRHHPPGYDGTGGPAVLEDWLRKFTKLFTTVGCPDRMKVDQAATYLQGRADTWWENHQDRLRLYHEETEEEEEFGWESFKKALRDEFFPEHLRHAKMAEFDNFKMKEGMTVEEYYTEFVALAAYSSDLALREDVLAARFERGLAVHILEKMQEGVPTTIRDMYLRAGYAQRLCDLRREVRAEKRRSEGSETGGGDKKRGSFSQPSKAKSETATSPVCRAVSSGGGGRGGGRRVRACWRCSKIHPGRNCDGQLITFYECGKLGHKAADCFRRTKGNSQGNTSSYGSANRGGGNQWRGGSTHGGGRGSGSHFQQGGGSTSQGGASGPRGGFGGRGRGNYGGGNRPITSASTVQEGVKNTGQLYAIAREEAKKDDHVVTGTCSER
ncbi:hypothetical protein RND81_01G120700 [Saponaria officinalis]|uniref:Retrotransposon gag domain-containing protein n=1 Tax=Saponaria officinalis TaxID=3572 RepID=A0AAW1N6X2_SAPOF